MRHLTYTGEWAGTYLCGRYRTRLGYGSIGQKADGDTSLHFVYASDELVADEKTCPDCRHLATCNKATELEYQSPCCALAYHEAIPAPHPTSIEFP